MSSGSSVGVIPAGPEHAAAIAAIYAPVVTDTAISFESVPPDTDEVRRRMVASSLPWYVAESGGTVVGYAHAGTLPEAGFKHGRWIDVGLWVRRF